MKIIYLCGLYPETLKDEINLLSKGLIKYGPNKLQYTFLEGFGLFFDDISVITAPLLGTFPKSYRTVFIKSSRFNILGKDNGYSVSIITLPFISLVSKMINLFFKLIKIVQSKEQNLIFIYSPHILYFLLP